MLPLLVIGVLLVVQCAGLAAEHVAVQAAAAQIARAEASAAHGSDGQEVLRRAGISSGDARLLVSRERVPGDAAEWVHVELRVRSRAFRRLGLRPEAVGRAVARAE